MRIFLCRHGESAGDIEDRYGGDYDDPLSENGQKQSRELADKLDGFGIEVIYSSPRARANKTAEIISKSLGVPVIIAHDLRERNAYGVLTGMVKSEAQQKYPKEVEKLKKEKLRHAVAGSEGYDSFKARVIGEFKKITALKEYSIVCIVSHGGPVSCIVREVLKLGEISRLYDCAILEMETNNGKFNLVAVDGVEFESQNLLRR